MPTVHRKPNFAAAVAFVNGLRDADTGGSASVPGGPATLYGTCYALLTRYYLDPTTAPDERETRFILDCQDEQTGLFIGPELAGHHPGPDEKFDREHLLLHLACATLPVLRQWNIAPRHRLGFAERFCDLDELARWLEARDMTRAWLEGNNLLFVGQLLVDLRDHEKHPAAAAALAAWFDWLDRTVDPATGLWGSDGKCSHFAAMAGGYHQLLVYYHEGHPINAPRKLVDTVLDLQHADGGFAPGGGGGACEDVDAIDILVNLYKRQDYRRADIRAALRHALGHLRRMQNPDGGFVYKRDQPHTHMGIPHTDVPPNTSAMFPTWFRVHTLALIAEVLTDEPALAGRPFQFNRACSMGWHKTWDRAAHRISRAERMREFPKTARLGLRRLAAAFKP